MFLDNLIFMNYMSMVLTIIMYCILILSETQQYVMSFFEAVASLSLEKEETSSKHIHSVLKITNH